ncbi:MAG: helix-turn-helix domain-containing protein [Lachnospiraceae bacterium]|nr:helix-turn-helix domain-containing protein [Lachnospiraceae bacterium]
MLIRGDKYQFIKKFATINCNENLRVGFSNTFNQLTDLQYYYRQTFLALTLGLQYSPTIWSHHFRDYRFHLLNDLLSHELPLSCYAPEIEILRNYDIETNNTLLHTLDVYLKSHRNESHTADELFIHRGTLKYRLDKISQLTSINLNDPDELLWLHLILRLSDLEASEKTQV